MKLTRKQEAFCQEYLKDLNATQAAIRAGYSKKTAGSVGNENLKKLAIDNHIQKLLQKRSERTEITADSVLKNLQLAQDIALGKKDTFVVVRDSVGDGITDTVSKKIKKTDLTNYVKINEMYMRHLGMFNDKLKVEGEFNLEHFVKKIHDEGD